MRFSAYLGSALALFPTVALSLTITPSLHSICDSPSLVSETQIGENKDVTVQALKCANTITTAAVNEARIRDLSSLEKRQVNVCTTDCTYHEGI